MKIEVGKFYCTYSGAKVRIYAIDGLGKYCVHGAYFTGTGWESTEWTINGASIYDQSEDLVAEWKDEDVWLQSIPLGPEHGFDYKSKWTEFFSVPGLNVISSPAIPENSFWFLPPTSYDDWYKQKWEINQKLYESMTIYGSGVVKVTWDKTAQMCNCGGKIDTHKPECPEAKQSPYYQDLTPFYILDENPDRYLGLNKKCECGSDSLGSPKHSDYCPKFKED